MIIDPEIVISFRIVLFLYLFQFMPLDKIMFYGRLPGELILPPTGTAWILKYLPINEPSITYTNIAFRFFCLTAAAGFYTRFSALMAAVLGFYVLGIPQFFGKVNHYNHLIWFCLVFSVSRAGDFFSVDAIVRAIRKPELIPVPSALYTLSIRSVWILIGIIYFFPGLWKFYDSGYAWFFGENLRLKLFASWFWRPHWTPPILLTDYPTVCRLLGMGTAFFELSFIAMIFLPRLRTFAVLGGLLFHNLTYVFMSILFFYLQICYVVFFNWHKIFQRAARFFFKKDMIILYDGNCRLCQRTIAVLRVTDLFQHVNYVNVLEPQGRTVLDKHNIDQGRALKTMHVICGEKIDEGFLAYRTIAFRYPLLWPILPFLFVWPVPLIGKKIYQHIAESRHCSLPFSHFSKKAILQDKSFAQSFIPAIGMGLFLIIINSTLGFQKNAYAWPFSCYPTFSNTNTARVSAFQINVIDQNGHEIELTTKHLKAGFSFERYKGLIRRTLLVSDLTQRNKRLEVMWDRIKQNNTKFKNTKLIQFNSIIFSTLPENKHKNPLEKKLIYEYFPSPD